MGKLNLLHHKSWHVYSQKNRDRVKKDEEEDAKLKEKEKLRIQTAETEDRLNKLREKKNLKIDDEKGFNLFADVEAKMNNQNDEFVEDERKEKEKWNNKITSYLAGTGGKTDEKPWYAKDGFDKYESEKKETRKKPKSDSEKKKFLDPIAKLEKYEKKKQKFLKNIAKEESKSSKKSIEELRAERLSREKEEKLKTAKFLNPNYLSENDLKHKNNSKFYNSQFNPEFVRKEKSYNGNFNSDGKVRKYKPY
ncbi:hypothetical protein HDU92_003715 [Lobulomyces angularis]|nr:hypothetical protein HDU92_003715 [Lobulomyces angularis]